MNDVDFKPTGPPRPNQIYTSWRLHKALGLVARKMGHTREDIAEKVLGGWIAQQHPEIENWVQQHEADEKEFIKNLKPIPFDTPEKSMP